MKNFKKIGRLYEMMDMSGNYPPELLSMTVGDLLDKMESMDTTSSQDYESMGSLLTKVMNDVLAGTGYVAPASDVPTGTAMEPTVTSSTQISPEDQAANAMAAAADTEMPAVDFSSTDSTTGEDLENFNF